MSRISDLILRYLDRDAGSSGGTPVQYTCQGGTVRTAISSTLTGKDAASMSGALVRWDVGSNATAHKWGAVNSFTEAGSSSYVTFDQDLPNAVVLSDKFTLIRGGKWITDQRIPGLIVNGYSYDPTNLTGTTVDYAAMLNGAGNGTLTYSSADGTARWQPPAGTLGPGVAITALTAGQTVTLVGGGVSIEEKSKFLVLSRKASPALPVGNTSDTLALTVPKNVHMMTLVGQETLYGTIIYRPVGIINTNATDSIYNVKAYVPNPFTTAAQSTISSGTVPASGAGTLNITDATNWPVHCWVAKVDGSGVIQDVRYCYDRSGNTMTVMAPVNTGSWHRGFTPATWNTGNNIVPAPWQDIGLDAPSTNEFEDPATESSAPAGVTFSTPMSSSTGPTVGDMASGTIYCIWERFVIPANMRPMSNLVADLRVYAEVDQE